MKAALKKEFGGRKEENLITCATEKAPSSVLKKELQIHCRYCILSKADSVLRMQILQRAVTKQPGQKPFIADISSKTPLNLVRFLVLPSSSKVTRPGPIFLVLLSLDGYGGYSKRKLP